MKIIYLVRVVLFFLMTIMGVSVCFSRWDNTSVGVHISLILLLIIITLCFIYFIYRFLRSSNYAEILEDGIHIFSKKAKETREIVIVDWAEAKDCRWVEGDPKRYYMLLIFQWKATFGEKPIATYKGYPNPNEETVRMYRLDEQIDKLASGTTTVDEFRKLPFLLVLSGKKEFEKYHEMWKKRRAGTG